MNKTVKKIWNIAATVIVVLAVILAILLAGVRLFGLTPYAVLSGSMEPAYSTGDLLYVKSVEPESLKVGDVITFAADEETVVTHRIVEIQPDVNDPGVLRFVTKGDANDTDDKGTVHQANVIGKPVFDIPLLGYLSYVITTPPWTYVSIGVGAVLVFLVFLPDVLFENDKKDKKKKGKAENKEDAEDNSEASSSDSVVDK